MRDWLRRWLPARQAVTDWSAVAACAAQRGWLFKPARSQDGFVIEAPAADGWRLEWGPSHRDYLGRHELRLRAPLPIDPLGHAVVLPRSLQSALETELYTAFTDSVRTRVDDRMPEEVRWLAVSPRLGATALGPLKELVGAAGNVLPWLQAWLAGPLGPVLASTLAPGGLPGLPVVFMLQQGVLTLRAGMEQPEPGRLLELVGVFELAWAEGLRCAQALDEAPDDDAGDDAAPKSLPPA